MSKIKIENILKKKSNTPITCLTAYSKVTAQLSDGICDIILVGDSLGQVLYGMKTTKEVKLDMMILHGKAVNKYVRKSLVVIDMPYKTYTNKFIAYKNARKIIKSTKCDAVKLEGGKNISNIINYLVSKKIKVMGHIGLLPQTSKSFKAKGRTSYERKKILEDAISISNAGAFAIVIECVFENLSKIITNKISIPTIGIGASRHCDGQILVIDDMLGLSDFSPKFVKQYTYLKKIAKKAVKNYAKDVRLRRFPFVNNIYK
jgi:3-methyl-2-oxobutanoate hydroxymethyltransferase